MSRNLTLTTASGEAFTYRIERKYVPGFLGESLSNMFRPQDGSPRFTVTVSVPGSLVPRLGPEFDLLGQAGLEHVQALLEEGVRRDMRIVLLSSGGSEVTEMQGLRK